MTTTPTLDELITLLVRGASEELCFSGVNHELREDGTWRRSRVWRQNRLARIEDLSGDSTLIAGDRTYWRKWPSDPTFVALERPADHDTFDLGSWTMLDPDEYWRDWLTQDAEAVLTSLRQVTYEGRDALQFVAPEVKGGMPTLTVDVELGLEVRAKRADVGVFHCWTDLRTDESMNDDLFLHTAPLSSNLGS
ncbi:hypothetical protein [Nocardioides conyzicola]|uniref:TIGR03984 family CRISPR-associated protein n=1 Tax=Nocardioides conyzicola TaxID=1651781 RepID=A0ABP8WYP0_9ACTN